MSGQNRSATSRCRTCDGEHFLHVSTRDEGHEGGFEEYAACPDCNTRVDGSFWRPDGSKFVPLDPGRVRELARRGRLVSDEAAAELEQLVKGATL